MLVDHDVVYAPRQSNDRLLLGLKGSLNEYELALLRQRSVEARYEKARRGELVVAAPVGFLKTEDQRLEKDPDRRVQERIGLVFRKFMELGSVRQTLLWFLEEDLQVPSRAVDGRCFGSGHGILRSRAFSRIRPTAEPMCSGELSMVRVMMAARCAKRLAGVLVTSGCRCFPDTM